MKRRLKSYLVFTALLYRIVMYIILPVVLVGICFWLRNEQPGQAAMIAVMSLLMATEIISDNWIFGGIQAKDSAKLDFLRTSGKGMQIMQNALAMDLLRKFLSAASILALCNLAVSGGMAFGAGTLLYLVLVSYFFSVLGVLITRFFTSIWHNILVAYLATFLGILCCILLNLPYAVLWYDVLFVVLGTGISILAVKTALKRVKAQYAG